MNAVARLQPHEIVDDRNGVVVRRIVVGELATNCWAVHAVGSRRALLIDPGDEPDVVLDAVSDLDVAVIVLTHTHWDHVLGLPTIADAVGASVLVHPAESPVWPAELQHLHTHGHFDAGTATNDLLACGCRLAPAPGADPWDGVAHQAVHDGQRLTVGPLEFEVRHTPGHTPGGVSIVSPGHVFTGDTLFPGGPGLTGWPFSDFAVIIGSIEHRLFSLPPSTVVHPGHGRDTTIGAESPRLGAWIQRGW